MKALLSLVLLFPLALVAQTPEWKAATAKTVITPQEPGGGSSHRREAQTHPRPATSRLHEGGYEAYRSIIYWSNPLHPEKFADSLEERIISKVHEMWK